jgi:hypothetical protein
MMLTAEPVEERASGTQIETRRPFYLAPMPCTAEKPILNDMDTKGGADLIPVVVPALEAAAAAPVVVKPVVAAKGPVADAVPAPVTPQGGPEEATSACRGAGGVLGAPPGGGGGGGGEGGNTRQLVSTRAYSGRMQSRDAGNTHADG